MTEIHRGLNGIYFDRTTTCRIDGKEGRLYYRGYSIHDLAGQASFEEVAFLLFHGKLPSKSELESFQAELREGQKLPDAIHSVIEVVKDAHPMEVLRTATSALGALDSGESVLRTGIRLTAQVPAIVAAHHRIRNGRDPVAPDDSLGHAANFLYMLLGEKPSDHAARLLDKDFILHAEHGSNASSFTARVVTGTGANLHSAITAAIAALSGPAHGGAAENVMLMAKEIGSH